MYRKNGQYCPARQHRMPAKILMRFFNLQDFIIAFYSRNSFQGSHCLQLLHPDSGWFATYCKSQKATIKHKDSQVSVVFFSLCFVLFFWPKQKIPEEIWHLPY